MGLTPSPGPWLRRGLGLLLLALAALALAWWSGRDAPGPRPPTHLALLLPDGWPADDPAVQAWRDAADEAGFPLQLLGASALLRAPGRHRDAALIVPDTVHRRMNDALLAHLEQRVHEGALLMLVHDAGVADMDGRPHPQQSRLSVLAGVRYALPGQAGPEMRRLQQAWVEADAVPALRLPPGTLVRAGGAPPSMPLTPVTSRQPAAGAALAVAVAGPGPGRPTAQVFATAGRYDGRRLMQADDGSLLAGVRSAGAGRVLFVNLPLTTLRLQADGLFLHGFLRLFAQDLAGLPQLSPMPEARGALVLNWQIDSAQALPALQALDALGAFDVGPASLHLTAGPDNGRRGDGQGIDLARNAPMRAFLQRRLAGGDEVGSHGGWMHDAFGRSAHLLERGQAIELITRNSDFVRGATGRPVREYSAPLGNHPAWLTPWLRSQGVLAYHFSGDAGMPPTRSYQDGQRGPADIWAFPVLRFGSAAGLGEAHAQAVAGDDLAAWLVDVADYCADQRTLRVVGLHPPDALLFPQAVSRWLAHARSLVDAGRLHWTTMSRQAAFANRRLAVRWQLVDTAGDGGAGAIRQLQAEHPASLAQMSWLLPAADGAPAPQLLQGEAEIRRDGAQWRITAGAVQTLVVALPPSLPAQGRPPPGASPGTTAAVPGGPASSSRSS